MDWRDKKNREKAKAREEKRRKQRERALAKRYEKQKSAPIGGKKKLRTKGARNARYARFRRPVVAKWAQGDRRCSVIGCHNRPGEDGFPIQVDHKLDRENFPEIKEDENNVAVTCGQHNHIDRDSSGRKMPIVERLFEIFKMWGRASFVWCFERAFEAGKIKAKDFARVGGFMLEFDLGLHRYLDDPETREALDGLLPGDQSR